MDDWDIYGVNRVVVKNRDADAIDWYRVDVVDDDVVGG